MSRKIFRSVAVIVLLLSALSPLLFAQLPDPPPPAACAAINLEFTDAYATSEWSDPLNGYQIQGSATFEFDCDTQGFFSACQVCYGWQIMHLDNQGAGGWVVDKDFVFDTYQYGCGGPHHTFTMNNVEWPTMGDGVDPGTAFKIDYSASPRGIGAHLFDECSELLLDPEQVAITTGTTDG